MKTVKAKCKWSLGIGFGICSLLSTGAVASNYPSDYCDQHVRIKHEGPALFAHVGSGCDSAEIIGYKKWGILAQGNPESIDAIIIAECEDETRKTVVTLGREWHGTGYMSEPLSYYSLVPRSCYSHKSKISLAFSDGYQWDSKNGANYGHFGYGFYSYDFVEEHDTNEPGHGRVNFKAWDVIVEAMKR